MIWNDTAAHAARALPLEGTLNTRDLGGYPIADGLVTRSHSFLRSDGLDRLSEADKERLYAYGVRYVADFRSAREAAASPSGLANYRDVEYGRFPLLDELNPGGLFEALPSSMGELYCKLLDTGFHALRAALEAMAARPDACVLFHCTAGKDRTGVTAMLLLKLAGAEDAVVIADYLRTEENLSPALMGQLRELKSQGRQIPEHLLHAEPANMEAVLGHLNARYGDAQGYLRHIGLTDADIQALRAKLVGE